MHTEPQTEQIVSAPEVSPASESGESTSIKKHGGKRAGADRKPSAVKILLKGTSRARLLKALENVNPELVSAKITKLLQSKKEIFWLQTLNFIYDRILGKPRQDVSVSGAFVHAEVRDPILLGWPKGALAKLATRYDEAFRETAREYGLDIAQNAPHFQDKSSTAIEAEVESEALKA